MNVFPGMSDAEFEAEIQKEAERLNHEFSRFVRSGKSYEEFLLENDIADFEKTLQARKKQEQAQQQQRKQNPNAEPSEQNNISDQPVPSAGSTSILRTIDELLMDLEHKKDLMIPKKNQESKLPDFTVQKPKDIKDKEPPIAPHFSNEKKSSTTLEDILKNAQKTEKDPLDFLENL